MTTSAQRAAAMKITDSVSWLFSPPILRRWQLQSNDDVAAEDGHARGDDGDGDKIDVFQNFFFRQFRLSSVFLSEYAVS